MKSNVAKLLLMFILGGVVSTVVSGILTQRNYGRLANHRHCDMSIESLGSQEMSNAVYYHRKALANKEP